MYKNLWLELLPTEEEKQELDALISAYQEMHNSIMAALEKERDVTGKLPNITWCNDYVKKNFADIKSGHAMSAIDIARRWYVYGGYATAKKDTKLKTAHYLFAPKVHLNKKTSYAINYRKGEPDLEKKLNIRITNAYKQGGKKLNLKFKVMDRNSKQTLELWRLFIYDFLYDKGELGNYVVSQDGNVTSFQAMMLKSFGQYAKASEEQKAVWMDNPNLIPAYKKYLDNYDFSLANYHRNNWRQKFAEYTSGMNTFERTQFLNKKLELSVPDICNAELCREDGKYYMNIILSWEPVGYTIEKPSIGLDRFEVFFSAKNGMMVYKNGEKLDMEPYFEENRRIYCAENFIEEFDLLKKRRHKARKRKNWKHYNGLKKKIKRFVRGMGTAYGIALTKLVGDFGGMVAIGYEHGEGMNWTAMWAIERMVKALTEYDISLYDKVITPRNVEIVTEDEYRFKDLEDFRSRMADRLRIKTKEELNKGIKLNLENIFLL